MSGFGRPNATGRSSGKLLRSERRLLAPPPGKSWVWITGDLLASEAWRGMSRPCHRFISYLMLEHCAHAGRENGRLKAPYCQLVRFGVSRKQVRASITEAIGRGLVAAEQRGGLYGPDRHRTPSLFRLTWLGCVNPVREATNEWRHYRQKSNSPVPIVGTIPVPIVGTGAITKAAERAMR